MNKKTLLTIIISISLITALSITGIYLYNDQMTEIEAEQKPGNTLQTTENTEEVIEETTPETVETYQYYADLEDVLSKTTIPQQRNLLRTGIMSGVAKYRYQDETYNLYVEFENLPIPLNDDFYEGWIIRQTPFAFISTGKLETMNEKTTNTFTSTNDYREYNLYILTIEPNDGDPAPAGHVLEGSMIIEIR